MPKLTTVFVVMMAAAMCPSAAVDAGQVLWEGSAPRARLVPPNLDGPMGEIAQNTINGYLSEACGYTLPVAREAPDSGMCIVVGDAGNNPVVASLVSAGLNIDCSDVGDEGFRIVTHDAGGRHFVVVTGNSPLGLKHGCQELVYFRCALTNHKAEIDWPMDIRRKPAFGYRGVYMLPCWAAYDSLHAWKRVLKFHSELTLNRNWFWLAGFPLRKEYGGEYEGADLAHLENVRELIGLCQQQGMKFYIGGGWFNWHHGKAVGNSIDKGIQYYLDLLAGLPQADGIYLEPAGEGKGRGDQAAKEEIGRTHAEAIRRLAETIWRDRPDFEFAIAIGQFNPESYRRAIHEIDARRLYWWWCWGDPLRDEALEQHPLVLRWHTVVQMSNFHGSTAPPSAAEADLTGFATSYDPGMGFGNPWNGWAAMGIDFPREFDPRTMPYFSHQYLFRERCWDVNLTEDAFADRLSRRLFDSDMPDEAIRHYLWLAEQCPRPAEIDSQKLNKCARFIEAHLEKGTHRNRDTLRRMHEAVGGIRRQLAKEKKKP